MLLSRDVYISTGEEHRSKLGQFEPAAKRQPVRRGEHNSSSATVSFNRRPGGLERDRSHRPNLNKRHYEQTWAAAIARRCTYANQLRRTLAYWWQCSDLAANVTTR